MHLKSSALALAGALLCGSTAAAQAPDPASRASLGFWGPADTFWNGAEELPPCSRSDVRRNPFSLSTPRFLAASQARHAELVGEILGPAPLIQQVVATARRCVAAPGVTDTLPVLLADGSVGFSRFHTAFSSCMAGEDAAQYLGSMTLWIDNRCDW